MPAIIIIAGERESWSRKCYTRIIIDSIIIIVADSAFYRHKIQNFYKAFWGKNDI